VEMAKIIINAKLSFIPIKSILISVSLKNPIWYDEIGIEIPDSQYLSEEIDKKLNKLINTEFNKEINKYSGALKLRRILHRIDQIKPKTPPQF